MVGIYKIVNPSGSVYVGQSRDIKKRWFAHRHEKRSIHKYPMVYSLRKYGPEAHRFEVIHELPLDIEQINLDAHEQLYIDLYRYTGHRVLNIRGAGSVGKHSEETKRLISIKSKERGRTREHIENTIARNKSRTGYKMSQQTKDKISERAKKRGLQTIGFTGRSHTEDSKNKISASCAKRRDSPETKLKKSIAAKKRPPLSEEIRNKISLAHKGKKIPIESIIKREATRREKYLKKKEGCDAV